MPDNQTPPAAPAGDPRAGTTLRLIWPQWQGAGPDVVEALYSDVPLGDARRAYTLGTRLLTALLPSHPGPTASVPVPMDDAGLAHRDGVDAKQAVVAQLADALRLIEDHRPERILTLGGDCAVSVAPFSSLAHRYGDSLAVVWIDSHPDVGTPSSEYHGYHAMAVAAITGHGDPDVVDQLPATVRGDRVALAGLHAWTEDDIGNVDAWGVTAFSPEALRDSTDPLLGWLQSTGCQQLAIHLDVDVIDSDEVVLGLGIEPGGLTTTQVRRIVDDLRGAVDVVGLTIAEYVPRQALRLEALLAGFPLLG